MALSSITRENGEHLTSASPITFYRGALDDIKEKIPNIIDGQLYFAVDTKQIYLDYDVEGGALEGPERIKFGGSTGIWYGRKEDEPDAGQVVFRLIQLEDATDYPSPKDLILNSDGSFFKVTDVDASKDEIIAIRLTVAGVGGGGGGTTGSSYIDYKRVGVKNRYFSIRDAQMLLTFQAYSTAGEDTEMGAVIYLTDAGGVRHNIGTVNNIGQSWGDEDPLTLDIKPYLNAFGVTQNVAYDIELSIFDDVGNQSLKTIPFTVTTFDMYVKEYNMSLGSVNSGFSYRCIPVFYTKLEDVRLFYRVTNIAYSNVVQTNYPDDGIALVNSDNNNAYLLNINGEIPVGSYKIEAWVRAVIPNTNGQTVVSSEPLVQTFIRTTADSSDPILSIDFPTSAIEYKQYATVNIPYFIAYRNDTISVTRIVEFTDAETGETTTSREVLEQATETEHTWTYRFMNLGTYKFTVQVGANTMNASVSDLYAIINKSDDIPTIASGGLQLNLIANKDNDAKDRESWVSITDQGTYASRLTGFNWISNGWRTMNGETSLYLNNGAKVEIPFSPFTSAGAEVEGTTIEFDVKISNIRDRHQELIKCVSRDSDGLLYAGAIINGDYFTLNSSAQKPIDDYNSLGYINLSRAGMTATYVPGKRVRISFVITPDGKTPYNGMASNMVCTYVNGVLSGFVSYGEDTFSKAPVETKESGKFIFDSTYADIDIYNIRVYETALTDRAVLGNYFATFPDFSEAAARWEDNNLLDEDTGEISLQQVMAKGNIPYVLMRGGATVDGKKGKNFILPKTTGLPVDKKDYKLVDVCFIDPEHPEKNIGGLKSEERVEWVIYAQGTSSMEYPLKNLRTIYARDNIGETYQLFDDLPAVDLFCFKVDYMESSSAHNTGLGNMLNEIYGTIKPPSRLIEDKDENGKKYDYVTAIKGRPCVIFFKETSVDPRELRQSADNYEGYKYIGRYNFNLDKSTHEPFGFYNNYEKRYGIAVQNPPMLTSNYATELAATTPIDNAYHATLDGNPKEGKDYYKDPLGKTKWTWAEIAEWDAEEEEYVWKLTAPAYENTGRTGMNSIQVWECLDNNKPLTHFTQPWTEQSDPDNALWVENFESRFPEYEVQEMSDKRDLQRLINWIAETNCMYTKSHTEMVPDKDNKEDPNAMKEQIVTEYFVHSHEPTTDDIDAGNIPDDLAPLMPDAENPRLPIVIATSSSGKKEYGNIDGYYYDSYEYRLHKFRKEFDNYFESDLTMVYYILSEFLLMTDSRAKNMMLCTFTARCTDKAGNSKTKWFPIFYDMDTGLALNNMGQLKFTYKDEDWYEDIFNAEAGYVNQRGTLNKSYSALWANIQLTMYDRLKKVYQTLRGGAFNYDYLLNGYNKNQAEAWNETYINKDSYLKYIEPYINPTAWKVMIDACQGTRSLHREQFLQRRFLYMDSKYAYIAGGMGLSLRVNDLQKHPGDIFNFDLTTNDAMYLVSQFGNEQPVRSTNVIDENTTVNISTRAPSGGQVGEQPYYLYLINNIRSFGDMSDMGIQTFDPFQTAPEVPADPKIDYVNNIKLNELQLSTNEEQYEFELKNNNRMAALNIVKYFPMLEDLNVGYWNNLGSLDLRYNKNLKKLEAFGTVLTSCQFPQGGVLEHLQLPATLKRVALAGHYNLDTIEYKQYESNYAAVQATQQGEIPPDPEVLVSREEAWDQLTGLSIEQCPKLDTKTIFKAMKEDNLQIFFPDINWTLEADEFNTTTVNGVQMVSNIPILDKLLRQSGYNGGQDRDTPVLDAEGNPTYDENGDPITEPALNRSYVGGTITLKNGQNIGVDEALMYETYTKYYPLITIKYDDNAHCISAYSLNTHDANGELMVGNSPKFTSENVTEAFTLEKVFGTEATGIKIDPIEKMPTNEYVFTFKGWNTEGVLTFSERDYKTATNTIEESVALATEACEAKVSIAWDGKSYAPANGFNFAQVFGDDQQVLNIYPTFVATVRTWTAKFADGRGNVLDEQKIRYGEKAIVPDIVPLNIQLDPNDVTKVYSYEFLRYGAVNETYIIVADKQFDAVYASEPRDFKQLPVADSYFTIDANGRALLNEGYVAEAICVPAKVNGTTINTLYLGEAHPTIKRVFFENSNAITILDAECCSQWPQLEYVDFAALKSLEEIRQYAFQYAENMTVSEFSSTVKSIGERAFNSCKKLEVSRLPYSLREMGQGAFAGCSKLGALLNDNPLITHVPNYCFNNCTNLKLDGNDIFHSVEEVGQSAFEGCSALVLNFESTLKMRIVGDSAFEKTNNISLNQLPESVTTIQKEAFRGATTAEAKDQHINLMEMPDALTYIGSKAFDRRYLVHGELDFSNCTELTIDGIASGAFTGLLNFNTLILPPKISIEQAEGKRLSWGLEATTVFEKR